MDNSTMEKEENLSVRKLETVVDEEDYIGVFKDNYKEPSDIVAEPIYLCKCLLSADSSKEVEVSPRKKKILSTVARTEEYLRVRRIPELIRFLLTKVIAHAPVSPVTFMQTLMDDCMLYRAGHGQAPVLYEERHLQAVVNSFDPGNRGWLSAGQVRRAFTTLGLTPPDNLNDRIPCDVVLYDLKETQETELYKLLSAGFESNEDASTEDLQCDSSRSNNNITCNMD